MSRIHCPPCGPRNETEFTYGADATMRRPQDGEQALGRWLD